ncbi:MAG: DUF4832 domain-containing protein [Capsulimonadaceae bacterium]|nr:DUF4832 domain-containing protein [Capsulimonadaceae bacterium]
MIRIVTLCVLALLAPLAVSPTRAADAPVKTIVVHPVDNGKALVNPMMGWVFHYYSDSRREFGWNLEPSDTVDDFPGLSTVYLRLPWAYIEPSEGTFNWAIFDTPAQRWIAKGKKVAIRITSTEGIPKYATPIWVKEAGAKGHYMREHHEADEKTGGLWEPDYDDPVFLDKLDGLVKALAEHYDGNSNIAFVDIGSYGMWGEGHKVNVSNTPDEDAPVYQKHTDLYLKYFKHTLLTINDDTIGPQRQGRKFITTEYARARGVTLRDDSILVGRPPHSYFHSELAEDFWPDRPVVLEHQPYGASVHDHAWYPDLLLKAVEDYHASFLSLHWWPRVELNENREIITKINRRLGYRIVPRSIEYPDTVMVGQPFTVKSTWSNEGVAPCYPGGFPCLTIKDAKGGIVSCLADGAFNVRDLQIGPAARIPESSRTSLLTAGLFAPNAADGTYDLYLSIGQQDGTPAIALPLDGDDGQHRYKIGKIKIAGMETAFTREPGAPKAYAIAPSILGFGGGNAHNYAFRLGFDVHEKAPAGSSVFMHLINVGEITDQPPCGIAAKPEDWPIGIVKGTLVNRELPPGTADGDYQLLIGIWTPADGSRVPLSGEDDGEFRYLLGTIRVRDHGKSISMPGVPRLPAPPPVVHAPVAPKVYASKTSIVKVFPAVSRFTQTGPRQFTLCVEWDVRETAPADYIPFLHLCGPPPAADPLIVLPTGSDTPAAYWPVGEKHSGGDVSLELPSEIADGNYEIKAGLFMPDGKPERLKLAAGDDGAQRVVLGTLRVAQNGAKLSFEAAQAK